MTELIQSIKTLCQDMHFECPIADEKLQSYDEQTLRALLDYYQQWHDCLDTFSNPIDEEAAEELLGVDWGTQFIFLN